MGNIEGGGSYFWRVRHGQRLDQAQKDGGGVSSLALNELDYVENARVESLDSYDALEPLTKKGYRQTLISMYRLAHVLKPISPERIQMYSYSVRGTVLEMAFRGYHQQIRGERPLGRRYPTVLYSAPEQSNGVSAYMFAHNYPDFKPFQESREKGYQDLRTRLMNRPVMGPFTPEQQRIIDWKRSTGAISNERDIYGESLLEMKEGRIRQRWEKTRDAIQKPGQISLWLGSQGEGDMFVANMLGLEKPDDMVAFLQKSKPNGSQSPNCTQLLLSKGRNDEQWNYEGISFLDDENFAQIEQGLDELVKERPAHTDELYLLPQLKQQLLFPPEFSFPEVK